MRVGEGRKRESGSVIDLRVVAMHKSIAWFAYGFLNQAAVTRQTIV